MCKKYLGMQMWPYEWGLRYHLPIAEFWPINKYKRNPDVLQKYFDLHDRTGLSVWGFS